MRSLLSIHPDSITKIEDAAPSQADGIIINIERFGNKSRSILQDIKGVVKAFYRNRQVFIQLHLDVSNDDLEAVVSLRPKGIFLSGVVGNSGVQHLATRLRVFEALSGLDNGQIGIIPLINSSSASLAATALQRHERVIAIGWMPFHINPDFTAADIMDQNGDYFEVPRHARMMCLLAAGHLAVPAIDAPFPLAIHDALYRHTIMARRDGFRAKIAGAERQVLVINELFDKD